MKQPSFHYKCIFFFFLILFLFSGCSKKEPPTLSSTAKMTDTESFASKEQLSLSHEMETTVSSSTISYDEGQIKEIIVTLTNYFTKNYPEYTEASKEEFWQWIHTSYDPSYLHLFLDMIHTGTFENSSWHAILGATYHVLSDSYLGLLSNEKSANSHRIYRKECADTHTITLTFGGDVSLDDNWANMGALRSRPQGILDCLSPDLVSEMQSADITMINNEFPYSKRGEPLPDKQFTFRANPERVDILHQIGVDIVSLANNHAYDFGPDALVDSLDVLRNAGIPYVGAGKNIEEASAPVYIIANGMKIAYVSATQIERVDNPDTKEATQTEPGVLRTRNPEKFLEVIRTAEKNSDFVIVYVHWGSENVALVEQNQRDLATQYVLAGADLIMGDHSHCLQGFEYIESVPVLYSLGNFWFNSKTVDTCLIKVQLDPSSGTIASYQMLPAIQQNCTTSLVHGNEKERILQYMESISYGGILLDPEGYLIQGSAVSSLH